jgi:hypothetical protein
MKISETELLKHKLNNSKHYTTFLTAYENNLDTLIQDDKPYIIYNNYAYYVSTVTRAYNIINGIVTNQYTIRIIMSPPWKNQQ